jgi:hypothetical protein
MPDAENGLGRPNIRTSRGNHRRYCTQPRLKIEEWGQPGDVRRCEHGRIMLGFEVPGTIPPYWRDLSPIWTPILYRRALNALTRVLPPGGGRS